MCVTVDNFNVFEAKIEKTNIFEMNKGTIAISIDDLDAYVKYFNSELCFLHYLKHRQAATRIKCLMFNDELDHLGMYISQNIYEEYVNDYKLLLVEARKSGLPLHNANNIDFRLQSKLNLPLQEAQKYMQMYGKQQVSETCHSNVNMLY